MKVLIIEDTKFHTEMIAQMLVSLGHEVIKTYSVEDIKSKVIQYQPDVIMLDIHLNYENVTVDGIDLIPKIREWSKAHPAFVIYSEDVSEHNLKRAMFFGVVDMIAKPTSVRVLNAKLEKAKLQNGIK